MYCQRQTAQLCRKAERLKRERNLQVIVVESHEPYRVRDTLRKGGVDLTRIAISVACDTAQTVAASYGVAFQMNDKIEWANRPATFLIGRDGIVRYEYRAVTSYFDRPSLGEVLKAHDAMRGRTHHQG
ncbi:MAG: redoxin domain-containing protein [Isosphaeraceae bacterium]